MLIYATGSNLKGQFGVGDDQDDISHFIKVLELPKEYECDQVLLGAGANHSIVAIKHSNSIWVSGDNSNGQLGCGNNPSITLKNWKRSRLEYLTIENLYCGWDTSFLIDIEGKVWAAGSNRHATLGLQERRDYNEWTLLPIDTEAPAAEITKISCGWRHTLFLSADGSVYASGMLEKCALVSLSMKTSNATKKLNIGCKIIDMACGMYHSVFLNESNQVIVLGRDKYQILGLEDTINKSIPHGDPPLSVYSGWSTIAFKTRSRQFYTWGRCDLGQTGRNYTDPTLKSTPYPEPIDFTTSRASTSTSKILDVSMGSESTIVLMDDGTVFSYGYNDHGNLGLGHLDNINTPSMIPKLNCIAIAAGFGHTLLCVK